MRRIRESQQSRATPQVSDSSQTAQSPTAPKDEYQDVMTKGEGLERWLELMTDRFVAGKDDDFNYEKVDRNEELDDTQHIKRCLEERWFDQEEPSWERGENELNEIQGQTGVQDF